MYVATHILSLLSSEKYLFLIYQRADNCNYKHTTKIKKSDSPYMVNKNIDMSLYLFEFFVSKKIITQIIFCL